MAKCKKCVVCGTEFTPYKSLQKCCGVDCAIQLAKIKVAKDKEKKAKQREREEAAKVKAIKQRIRDNDRSYWLEAAQKQVNKYIRLRDRGLPCIACGKPYQANFQASHYVPRGRSAFLRFHEDNIHGGCVQCNLWENGNLRMYRIGLIQRIGIERVDWLEQNASTTKKWEISELKEMVDDYKAKCKELE